MKGDPRVIRSLRARMVDELTAVNQYEAHYSALVIWGYVKLAEQLRDRADDERRHYGMLGERVKFLEGDIPGGEINQVNIGQEVPEMFKSDLDAEAIAVSGYRETATIALDAGDFVSYQLALQILAEEEEHTREIEAERTQMEQMTIPNYLSAKI